MIRLRPGWLVVLFAAVIAVSGWLPWRSTTANGGGHSSAIGGWVGYFGPPSKFDAGQLIVLLASGLIVAGAMTARGLSARMSAVAALVLSLSIGGLTVVYYQQKIHPPVDVAYGLYIGAAATVVAVICSVWALFSVSAPEHVPR
jgi:hypothetical protein